MAEIEGRQLPISAGCALIRRMNHGQKITFELMRASGVRGILVYCSDYKCAHSVALSADQWPDHLRLSDIEGQFVCQVCGKHGADVRPDFNWDKKPAGWHGLSVVPWVPRNRTGSAIRTGRNFRVGECSGQRGVLLRPTIWKAALRATESWKELLS